MNTTPAFNIDKQTQTVQGQMTGLLSSDNPYIKQAREQGQSYASSRGLLNSSMGAKAAQSAAIEAALPIAQADASTYNAFANMAYGDQLQRGLNQQIQGFTQDNMRLTDTIEQNQMRLQNALGRGDMELANQLQSRLNQQMQGFEQDNMRLSDSLQQGQMTLQDTIQRGQMGLANQLQSQLDAQQQGYTQANMTLGDELQRKQMELQNALGQGDMVLANQLQREIDAQQQLYQQENMQLSNQYSQSDMRLQQQLNELQSQSDYARQLGQMDKAAELDRQMASLQQQYAQDNMQMDQQWRSGEAATERAFQSDQSALDRQQQMEMQSRELEAKLQELGMNFDNSLKLTDAQQQYNILNQGLQGISAILADPNMDNAAKQQAIANQNAAINSQLQFVAKITGQDTPTYG
ncbi:hypothetical protein [Marinobacterium sp. MBR-109]|jgi:hypothetical protein|uniref:hypothetical protein n=1 Tax=Marinobacterium sp. MBR-109 TaxID=3156462 RepID=UPI00339B777E